MSEFQRYNLSGVSSDVEFGKRGPRLTSDGSKFSARDSSYTLTNLMVKDGAADQDAVAFKQMNTTISTALSRLVSGIVHKGSFDASTGILPTPIAKGDFYKVSAAGTIGSLELAIGDMIIANDSQSSGVTSPSQFDKIDNTESPDILRTGDISSEADLTWTDNGMDQDLATRGVIAAYVNTTVAAAGITASYGGIRTTLSSFTHESAASFNVGDIIPEVSTVIQILIKVDEPFNGVGVDFTIGDSETPDSLSASEEVNLSEIGEYVTQTDVDNLIPQQYIGSFVSGGSTTGSATVIITYRAALAVLDEDVITINYN